MFAFSGPIYPQKPSVVGRNNENINVFSFFPTCNDKQHQLCCLRHHFPFIDGEFLCVPIIPGNPLLETVLANKTELVQIYSGFSVFFVRADLNGTMTPFLIGTPFFKLF